MPSLRFALVRIFIARDVPVMCGLPAIAGTGKGAMGVFLGERVVAIDRRTRIARAPGPPAGERVPGKYRRAHSANVGRVILRPAPMTTSSRR
jgi:hypothetical protein